MAAEETIQEKKRRLALSLDASRSGLSVHGRALRHRLHPGRALRNELQRHPLRFFAVTAGSVAFLTFLLKRPRRAKKAHFLPRSVRSLLVTFAKPALAFWFRKQAKAYFETPSGQPLKDSLLGP